MQINSQTWSLFSSIGLIICILLILIMGEARRRVELGLPPREKKIEVNKSDRYFSWLPITKSKIKKYPYMGVATMALGVIIFLISGGANSISN